MLPCEGMVAEEGLIWCRFILSMAIALGLGTTLVPGWATNHLWPVVPSMSSGLRGFRYSFAQQATPDRSLIGDAVLLAQESRCECLQGLRDEESSW